MGDLVRIHSKDCKLFRVQMRKGLRVGDMRNCVYSLASLVASKLRDLDWDEDDVYDLLRDAVEGGLEDAYDE